MTADYRDLSFWFDSLAADGSAPLEPRSGLRGDVTTDVYIVGGGLTGLWTAYYLKRAHPALSITVVEKHVAGYGASGRNGGWCSALFPTSTAGLRRAYGDAAAAVMRRAMIDTVDEVGRVIEAEGIDCDFVKGGTLTFARSAVQRAAAAAEVAGARSFGIDPLELVTDGSAGVGSAHARALAATSSLAAAFDPNCARLHPAKLVRGLAAVVERLGVVIAEQTEAVEWAPHRVLYSSVDGTGGADGEGIIHCDTVVLATEGYGAALPGIGRRILPLYSLMIATEPLPTSFWDEVGIEHGTTFSDYRHLLIYGQRTADDRFAFGGRGARYHWGSSIRPEYDRVQRVFDHLEQALVELFPAAGGVGVTHRWGGPLGVARDWHASASYNPRTGVAFAGGYVGDGLSTTNLAGRTLAELIGGDGGDLTGLPWVNHLSPRWEPEPLRFIGANLGLVGTTLADAEERVTGRPSLASRVLGPLTGH
ncbi:NAD(P)/FAD-dependent oxidoreductase [Herbiconiux sp. P18]|uniref:NAD(P)/FAD-dependent oxidoreductase n=1 Tax=Herbiconiux liangxiaofengii TaxID=3342795 RepID=UPI0035B7C409